ncbi:MAG: hypothetical protein JHC74_09545 [Thermoleophilia bacterium]|nr:hypothetical protein [Thermoleophilia bacterium]
MPLLHATDIRPGDSIETAPGEWTIAHRVTLCDGSARVELDRGPGAALLPDGGGGGPVWSVERSRRFVMWHVHPDGGADGRAIVWSHAFSV